MGRRKKPKTITDVNITGIADRGKAVGRDPEGQVYFIDGAVPGDLIDATIFKNKKGVGIGVIKEMKEASPYRTEAFCQHFDQCGGCKWQHMTYEGQLIYKEKEVHAAFQRIAKTPVGEMIPIMGADPVTHYRNKMEYSFSTRRWVPQEELDQEGEVSFGPAVGFFRAGAFDKVVDIYNCQLQDGYANEIRNFVRDTAVDKNWIFYNIREHHGFLRNIILRNNRKGEWMLNLVFGENNPDQIEELLSLIDQKFDQVISMWYTVNEKLNDTIVDQDILHYSGQDHIVESIGDTQFRIGPKSFFQTNSYQVQQLYQSIADFCEFQGSENVYDLYTGLGSIALYLSKHCKQVVGIEEIPEATEDANVNKKLNNIENAVFYAGDVKDILTETFAERHQKPDIVITDPPRIGMHDDVVKMLLQLKAPKIVYVSCNPATQARDVAKLSELYDVVKMKPVDMFPHTHHIENIALLKLRNEKS